jgi:DNA-binding GntR family transcriptional regulator
MGGEMIDVLTHVHAVAAPVRQKVFEKVREAITGGRLRPGQRLIEKDLCEMMGVSRPSVREALRHLESEGLIETIPNRGPVVATLTRDEAKGIYQVRAALEGLAAKLFAERASDAQVRELSNCVDTLARAMQRSDMAAIVAAKDRFYSVMFQGAGNPMIPQILRTMNGRVTLLRRVWLSSPKRWKSTLQEIKTVVAAIKKRDGDAALRACEIHIAYAAEVALATLDGQLRAATADVAAQTPKRKRRGR